LRILVRDPPSTADPAQHQVSNHTRGILGDQRKLRNEPVRRPNALDERRDLVGVLDECRADHLCDDGVVHVALGTDDDPLGHGAMVVGRRDDAHAVSVLHRRAVVPDARLSSRLDQLRSSLDATAPLPARPNAGEDFS
jgi:hypothetical protein